MKRSITTFSLLLTSVSAILGSGWLFSAFYSATFAGPAASLAWIIGGLMMIVIAFVFAEVCSLMPITGSSIRIPHFTHGTICSFTFAWVIWLSYMVLAPTEIQAVVQYLSFYFPQLTTTQGSLTHVGYVAATVLMLLVSIINTYSLRWLIHLNTFLTLLKIFIPVLISAIVLSHFFHLSQFLHPANSSFMPQGLTGIASALSMGGIVFAFNGFKQAAEMAGEAKNPKIALPIAIIGSISLSLIIYLLLQTAFFSSLTPANIQNGWSQISLQGAMSPFANILMQDNLKAWLPLLFIGAIIGPLAAGMMYCASAGRSLYGMSKNKQVPSLFLKLSAQGNPVIAIFTNFALGMLMFAPLPGWNKMAEFLTSLMSITYVLGPITLLALRDQLQERKRPFKLPLAKIWSYVAFTICTLLIYWSGWDILSKLAVAMIVGISILVIHHWRKFGTVAHLNWRESTWVWVYFSGLLLISKLGTFGGGIGLLKLGTSSEILAVFCIGVLWLACRFKLPGRRVYDATHRTDPETL